MILMTCQSNESPIVIFSVMHVAGICKTSFVELSKTFDFGDLVGKCFSNALSKIVFTMRLASEPNNYKLCPPL